MMENAAAVDGTDVLGRRDLTEFGTRLEVVIDRGFRRILVTVSSLMIAGYLATVIAIVATALIR